MTSATEELRRLLDERGVEHYDGTESTLWLKDEHGYRASADELTNGRLSVHIWCDTPEQAIAATLGSGECKLEPLSALEMTLNMLSQTEWGACSECGCAVPMEARFCNECGRRVIDDRQGDWWDRFTQR